MDRIKEIALKANTARANANEALAKRDFAAAKMYVEEARKADAEFFAVTGRHF